MRRRRPIPPCPPRLLPEGSLGAKERDRAIAHFTAEDPRGKSFTFRAYDDDEVRAALSTAFAGVCAYCEAPIGATVIEHFRPKGAVRTEERTLPTGYYWLAANWENLLPSCHYCNTELWMGDGDSSRHKSGKGNWFPLADEAARATRACEEARERPLLLNPYFDEPSEHLEFGADGIVRPRLDDSGVESPRGEATIRILGLNRRGLPEAREAQLIRVKVARKKALKAQRRWQANPQDDRLARKHRKRVADLAKLLEREAGYSAMTAQHLGAAP